MRVLAERHNLKAGDKFVVVGGKHAIKNIGGINFTGGTVLVCNVVREDTNIKFTSKDIYGTIHNINIRGDSVAGYRVRFPYKNELKKG